MTLLDAISSKSLDYNYSVASIHELFNFARGEGISTRLKITEHAANDVNRFYLYLLLSCDGRLLIIRATISDASA